MGSPENIHDVNTMVAAPRNKSLTTPFPGVTLDVCGCSWKAEKLDHECKMTSEIATRCSQLNKKKY